MSGSTKFLGVAVLLATMALLLVFTKKDAVKEPLRLPPIKQAVQLPQLMDEETPYFSRQIRSTENPEVNEHHVHYRDGRYGVFSMKGEVLVRVCFYTGDIADRRLFFEADYEGNGRRIARSKWYRQNDGSLETSFERSPGGDEKSGFYSAASKPVKEILTLENGGQYITTFAEDGVNVLSREEVKAEVSERIFSRHSAENGGGPRIKMRVQGARVVSWDYFDKEGKRDHSASFDPDGTIRFASYCPTGALRRIQLWKEYGEDWSRVYYYLAEAEIYSEKEQNHPEHRAAFYPNGRAKHHYRFNKKGEIEATRDFNSQQEQTKMEEIDEKTGEKKVRIETEPRRAFIPDGLRGTPGTEDPKQPPAYNFSEGLPYAKMPESDGYNPLFVRDIAPPPAE